MIKEMRKRSEGNKYTSAWIWLLPYFFIVLALVLIAPYDLTLNQILYRSDHFLAMLFERVVLWPVELLVPLCFYALYRIRQEKRFFFCYMIAAIIIALEAVKYWTDQSYGYWIAALAAILSAWLAHQWLKTISRWRWKQQERFFLYVLAVFLSAMAITFLLKQCWGRVRFREMDGDFSLFTPWYQINGYNGHQSFPSAHTSTMSVILCFWHYHPNNRKELPLWVKGLLLVGVVLMMAMRMVAGAHFFSDVVVGFAITYSMILLWHAILERKR